VLSSAAIPGWLSKVAKSCSGRLNFYTYAKKEKDPASRWFWASKNPLKAFARGNEKTENLSRLFSTV